MVRLKRENLYVLAHNVRGFLYCSYITHFRIWDILEFLKFGASFWRTSNVFPGALVIFCGLKGIEFMLLVVMRDISDLTVLLLYSRFYQILIIITWIRRLTRFHRWIWGELFVSRCSFDCLDNLLFWLASKLKSFKHSTSNRLLSVFLIHLK
jgi:hypothetical protein